ncbi:MAG: hypothetical protein JSW11_03535 [Candidatus Heimdallarchaeota archaeon]|nr:MAG: hypothetical protein JSW11_03535 [Candidatus Heimdallarchaeota archaeon]
MGNNYFYHNNLSILIGYPLQLNEPDIFQMSGDVFDEREELENVLSITHYDPTKAQEGLTIFTLVYVNISSKENEGRTLSLTITNEDGLSTERSIIIGEGATTESLIGWPLISLSFGLISYFVLKRKKKKRERYTS